MSGTTRSTAVAATASLLAAAPLAAVTAADRWLVVAAVPIVLVATAGWALRRVRLPATTVVVIQTALVTWWLGVLAALGGPAAWSAGAVGWRAFVPSPEWADRLGDTAGAGVATLREHAAPVPVDPGVVVLLVGCVGVMAVAVDLVAVALRRVALAGPILASAYLVAAGVLPNGVPWAWFVPPACGYLLLLAVEHTRHVTHWGRGCAVDAAGLPKRPGTALARTARRVGGLALVAAVAVPAVLPGVGDGVLPGRWGDVERWASAPAPGEDPIVDIHRNLRRPDDVTVIEFTTWSGDPPYLRSAVYGEFDGRQWHQAGGDILGRVEVGLPPPPGLAATEVTLIGYDLTLTDDYPWRSLPLPYPSRYVDIEGEWYYDAATLAVVSPTDDPRGTSYHVEAVDVAADPEAMRDATDPGHRLDPMRELPDGLAETIRPYVEEAVGGAATGYDQARALEEWFRAGGGFTYDLDVVDQGGSAASLVTFLEDRRGYCEQYAATMAVMARSLGIPARLAVGFLPGERADDGRYIVSAHDAHAWPELYFAGTGWVGFEPTPPDRGTGIPDDTEPDAGQLDGDRPDGDRPGAAPTGSAGGSAGMPGLPGDGEPGITGVDGGSLAWLLGGAAAATIALAVAARSVSSRREHRRRWRRAAATPALAAEAAWADLRLMALDLGLTRASLASPRVTAHRLAEIVELDQESRRLLDGVVRAVERARYGPHVDPVPTLERDVAMLRRTLLRSRPAARRLLARLWPATGAAAGRGGTPPRPRPAG
ncbi:transglutaminaseTgpA domain-containing protein [Jiangella asiatica]|uniref:Transglutaminase domain-containing protein n=1 Tax=Jiangella asiatica TaxID=2530372 RepID=A0A4R5CAG7_9ACTN|nr:DUF3488 and transglutaminase-like domain-containing protein [Jiangella asiatica]TDD95696.1 transglutaminase domain-containing protein [Jiangella asiatica]